MLKSYQPTVLLVDDDAAATRYWRSLCHAKENLGCIEANSLRAAAKLLADPSIEIDAIVCDLFFDKDRDAPELELYNGVDLLYHSQINRPDLPRYVLSFFGDRSDYHDEAKKKGLEVKQWFPKTLVETKEHRSLWSVVHKDLFRAHLEHRNIDASEQVVSIVGVMDVPMRTYLQRLDSESFVIQKPIEVMVRKECEENEHLYIATALNLGLLQEGEGPSVDTALSDLGTLIEEQLQIFEHSPKTQFVGYAALVMQRLNEHILVRSKVKVE